VADLSGQVALVTGGAIGIGRGVALRLATAGAEIAVTYHSHSPDNLAASMAELGKKALALPLDATRSQSVEEVVEETYDRLGQLDIVVANAGGLVGRVPLTTMSDEHWHAVLELNLCSAFYLVRASLKRITKPGGRIVLMSSMAAHTGGSGGAGAYAAAKAGLLGLTRAFAKEVAPQGVTVNAVTPGLILGTPFHETFTPAEDQVATIARLPVGRSGAPADVAGLIAYLASPEAGFITGQVVNVSGGQELT